MSVSESAGSDGQVWSGFCAQCEKLRGRYQAVAVTLTYWRSGWVPSSGAWFTRMPASKDLGAFQFGNERKSHEQIVATAHGDESLAAMGEEVLDALVRLIRDAGVGLSPDDCKRYAVPFDGEPGPRFLAWVLELLDGDSEFVEYRRDRVPVGWMRKADAQTEPYSVDDDQYEMGYRIDERTTLRHPFEAMVEAVKRAGLLAPAKKKRKSQIDRMVERETKIKRAIAMVVAQPHRNSKDIAAELGISPSTLSRSVEYKRKAKGARLDEKAARLRRFQGLHGGAMGTSDEPDFDFEDEP